jgi:hypothetical protein
LLFVFPICIVIEEYDRCGGWFSSAIANRDQAIAGAVRVPGAALKEKAERLREWRLRYDFSFRVCRDGKTNQVVVGSGIVKRKARPLGLFGDRAV